MRDSVFIGIDLGTTNTTCTILRKSVEGKISCKSLEIYQASKIEQSGVSYELNTILPSRVFFPKDGFKVYCGKCLAATEGMLIREIKMKMGDDLWHYSFNGKALGPADISAIILKTVFKSICREIDDATLIKNVAITIPASFSSKMRRTTFTAAEHAGFDLDKLTLIDEPVSAMFSSWNVNESPDYMPPTAEPFMVYDIGGGTIDVSIMKIGQAQKQISVLATSRFNDIGGRTFDIEIASLILGIIENDSNTPDTLKTMIAGNSPETRKFILSLVEAGEKIKIALFDQNIPTGFDYRKFKDLLALIGPKMPAAVNLGEYLNTAGFDTDIFIPAKDIIACLEKFFPAEPGDESKPGLGWNIISPISQAIENYKKGVAPQICYLVGGSGFFKPVKMQLATLYDVREDLSAFYSVSDGAAKFLYLKSTGDWKIEERTTEKVFLKRTGAPFIQIMDSDIPIPSGYIRFDKFRDENSVEYKAGTSIVSVDFYQGDSPDDPFMHRLYSRKNDFEIPFINPAYLRSVTSHIDKNKKYEFKAEVQEQGFDPKSFTVSVVEKRSYARFEDLMANRIKKIQVNV